MSCDVSDNGINTMKWPVLSAFVFVSYNRILWTGFGERYSVSTLNTLLQVLEEVDTSSVQFGYRKPQFTVIG